MNKNVKRVSSLLLAGMLGSSVALFASCGNDEDAWKKNATKLSVKIFDGGLGHAWIDQLAEEFMDKFKNTSFEEGKTGINVEITPNKNFDDLHSNMHLGADAEDIYYTATNGLQDFTSLGVVYNVTDIMTAKVYNEAGNVTLAEDGKSWQVQETQRSIADKISVDYYKDAYNLGTVEKPLYYSLPYEDSISGIVVDWDLFVEEGWNDGKGIDGMPGTFQEFKQLLLRIQQAGYSAFSYSTAVGYYTPSVQRAVQAKVDGSAWYYDAYSDYTYDYDFNGNGTIEDNEKVTPETMEKTIDTKGMDYAVRMAYEMFKKDSTSNATFYDPNVTQGVSYGGAQQDFVMSKTSTNRPRIAMLLEGEWWENETRATFNSMGRIDENNGYGKREFRFMPIPKMSNADKSQKYTIGSFSSGCITIVNEKTVGNDPLKQQIAELWLQYQYSDHGLKTFTSHNGAVLPFDYELTPEEFENLTPFAQDVWNLHHNDEVEIVYDNPMMHSEKVRFTQQTMGFATKVSGTEYTDGLFNNFVKFRQAGKEVSVAEYLTGMHAYYDGKFTNAYTV